MAQQRIHISKIDSPDQTKFVISFDTGLDPRSFARAKMSQCLTEPGYVVSPDGSFEEWRASGVNEVNGFMRVWGPMFQGKRLDLIIDEAVNTDQSLVQQTASAEVASTEAPLQAIIAWIRAKMFLGDTGSALNPGSAFVLDGSVFFAPENMSNRCLFGEKGEIDRYNCPDLIGMDASAFCAGTMLYKIFAKSQAFPSREIYQDMREGVFLPIHLAAPQLNKKLSELIQAALSLPVTKKQYRFLEKSSLVTTKGSGLNILSEMLALLKQLVSDSSFIFTPIAEEKIAQIEKEKKAYLLKQNSVTGTRRFVTRNKYALVTASAVFLFLAMMIVSAIVRERPTTEGMSPIEVVYAYFDAFSRLDHTFMEAVINNRDVRQDANAAATMFAISRIRLAHEPGFRVFTAYEWLELGGTLPAQDVFGITNLYIEHIAGSEFDEVAVFRVEYYMWPLNEARQIIRSDVITLRPDRRERWRITEILRTER
ncbi:MAG: hypothetical protein FWC97_00860 [Treponema sp.]|nr:hypothetical protein [Treponema sp.]